VRERRPFSKLGALLSVSGAAVTVVAGRLLGVGRFQL